MEGQNKMNKVKRIKLDIAVDVSDGVGRGNIKVLSCYITDENEECAHVCDWHAETSKDHDKCTLLTCSQCKKQVTTSWDVY